MNRLGVDTYIWSKVKMKRRCIICQDNRYMVNLCSCWALCWHNKCVLHVAASCNICTRCVLCAGIMHTFCIHRHTNCTHGVHICFTCCICWHREYDCRKLASMLTISSLSYKSYETIKVRFVTYLTQTLRLVKFKKVVYISNVNLL